MRVLAIDWSGAKSRAQSSIWIGEASESGLVRLENGRDREQTVTHLIELADKDPDMVVGFDFAFSLPAWYPTERGVSTAPALWQLATSECDIWLDHKVRASREVPFWGGGRGTRPELPGEYRATDRNVPTFRGIAPQSTFKIGGPGSVGTGSVRGMAVLVELQKAGFAIWPFDVSRLPLVVEIYPRLLTQDVLKSDAFARKELLERRFPNLDSRLAAVAASNDDAFDAAVSALVMWEHHNDLLHLPRATKESLLLEGLIWHPTWRDFFPEI